MRHMILLTTGVLALFGMGQMARAADLLVPGEYPTIQEAINAANPGDTVWVAAGTYTGPGNRDINPLGKSITILGEEGADATIIDCEGAAGEPHRGFLITTGSAALIIDGFTVRNGYQTTGGGLQVFGLASPTIRNCVFDTCTATDKGGGVYVFGIASPSLSNCTFQNNAAWFGGGMHSSGTGSPSLADCSFTGNSASGVGGGYHTTGGSPTLTSCTFFGNSSFNDGGGFAARGAGSASLSQCTFDGNTADSGGGMSFSEYGENGSVSSCLITNNEANFGGGVRCMQGSSPTFRNTTISGNTAVNDGGGLEITEAGSAPVLEDCTISNNQAVSYSGGGLRAVWGAAPVLSGVTIEQNLAGSSGGGIALPVNADATILNCTITGNRCSNIGGGIYAGNGSDPVIEGCHIEGNSAAQGGGIVLEGGNGSVTACTIHNNASTGESGGLRLVGGNTSAITGCDISGNVSGSFGPVTIRVDSAPTISDCTISGNVNLGYGASGIHCENNGDALISACIIHGNVSGSEGAVFAGHGGSDVIVANSLIYGNNSTHASALTLVGDSTGKIVNSTLVGNYSSHAAAIRQFDGDLIIANSVVRGNVPLQLTVFGGTTSVSYTNIEGGFDGVGNIDADPLFVDPSIGDYRIPGGSPCIDAGDNTAVPADVLDMDADGDTNEPLPYDLGYLPRFVDDPLTPDTGTGAPPLVDMGAHEFSSECEGGGTGPDFDGDGQSDACDDDIDDDGVPNEEDVCDYTPVSAPPDMIEPDGSIGGDLDGDCDVDLIDYSMFQQRFTGASTP